MTAVKEKKKETFPPSKISTLCSPSLWPQKVFEFSSFISLRCAFPRWQFHVRRNAPNNVGLFSFSFFNKCVDLFVDNPILKTHQQPSDWFGCLSEQDTANSRTNKTDKLEQQFRRVEPDSKFTNQSIFFLFGFSFSFFCASFKFSYISGTQISADLCRSTRRGWSYDLPSFAFVWLAAFPLRGGTVDDNLCNKL